MLSLRCRELLFHHSSSAERSQQQQKLSKRKSPNRSEPLNKIKECHHSHHSHLERSKSPCILPQPCLNFMVDQWSWWYVAGLQAPGPVAERAALRSPASTYANSPLEAKHEGVDVRCFKVLQAHCPSRTPSWWFEDCKLNYANMFKAKSWHCNRKHR
jgi:hypothetical protein